mmetsp:Transcript_96066/g.271932  ORF Transcript_96066/g.271932 Transcript_96066/m.271932 type:complete len:258 (+) Transcript_96066:311-1084(+)
MGEPDPKPGRGVRFEGGPANLHELRAVEDGDGLPLPPQAHDVARGPLPTLAGAGFDNEPVVCGDEEVCVARRHCAYADHIPLTTRKLLLVENKHHAAIRPQDSTARQQLIHTDPSGRRLPELRARQETARRILANRSAEPRSPACCCGAALRGARIQTWRFGGPPREHRWHSLGVKSLMDVCETSLAAPIPGCTGTHWHFARPWLAGAHRRKSLTHLRRDLHQCPAHELLHRHLVLHGLRRFARSGPVLGHGAVSRP